MLEDRVSFGASVTHAALAKAIAGLPGLEGLAAAATGAANPAIRRVATVGGNLCALDFAAADLVPTLLALDARLNWRCRTARASCRSPAFSKSASHF